MERFSNFLVGGSGIGAIELVQNAPLPDVSSGSSIISTLIQVVIGVITLIKLLKKNKNI